MRFKPIDDEEIAVFIHPPQIAAAKESFAVEFDEYLRGVLGFVPVAQEYLRAVHDDLADLARRQFPQRRRIDDARIRIEDRDAEALLLRMVAQD